ncbi:DISARM system phospholipase D-like protein DrmC [Gandjariella thermophila]|uniref:phospholipase D n=1 Tax=Gandjariella thermophila TaxID=1931992 RepID=A0A4D4JIB8_9PSEU|nr:DISARM system phospholipase D-like protein DrmC [Gandjariella thermophila]GDY33653.1 hypothetical protein GTS_52860 [Gandjariella thermophila]
MVSSDASIDPVAARRIGLLLTGSEAKAIADRLADGDTLTAALRAVPQSRRADVRALLAGAATGARSCAIALLRAVEGARSVTTSISPIWTMPGHLATSGPLTSSVAHLIDGARQSITCSTFNFQKSSALWTALQAAAQRPELSVRIYLDTRAADENPKPWSPTTAEVAAHLKPAVVLRTVEFDGAPVRNHAKFLAIDHRFLLVTSANFSWSAEYGNVEFGVRIDNPNLTEAVEREMRRAEDSIYERITDEGGGHDGG